MKKTIFSIMFAIILGSFIASCDSKVATTGAEVDSTLVDSIELVDTASVDSVAIDSVCAE